MSIFVAIVLIILSVIAHEVGHALAMHSRKIELKEIGLGVKIRYIPHLKFKLSQFPEITFIISPLLIGAYVEPTEYGEWQLENLSYLDKSFVMGMGVLTNFILAGMLITVTFLLRDGLCLKLLIPLFAIIVLWLFRKFFCQYLIPVIGILFLGLLIFTIIRSPLEAVSGPIGIGNMIVHDAKNIWKAVGIASIVSLSLGLFNTIPIYPLDGGQIVEIWIKKLFPKLQDLYKLSGWMAFLSILIFVFFSDILKLF